LSLLEYLGLKPTLPRFAARVLKAMPPELAAEWSLDLERGVLVRPGGGEMSLKNMFSEYCATRVSRRAELIQKYASIAGSHLEEIPDLWVAAAKNVYPVVRSLFADMTLEIKSRMLDPPYLPVVIPFAGDLGLRLVYDFGSYLGYLKQDQLDTWGKTASEVLERGIANLAQLETPQWVDSGRGFFQLASPMSLGESMLLLDSVLRALPFAPHAVLMPCNRGVLLAADSRSEAAIGAMLSEAERCLEEAWPMSSAMCRRTEGAGKSSTRLRRMPTRHMGSPRVTLARTMPRKKRSWTRCTWPRARMSMSPSTPWFGLASNGRVTASGRRE
jgi:hypothetical protein